MTDKTKLIESLKHRDSRTGIVTADRYFRDVTECFEGGHCPVDIGGASEDEWRKKLSEAESRFTYTNPEMEVLSKSITKNSKEGILEFDAIITTPIRDRDGDVLETKGATVDPKMPLLWQHMPMQPIGKFMKTVKHTDSELRGRFVIADTALGRDSAALFKIGALRISHGFDPIEWKEMDDGDGWRFLKYLIYEASGVSIPSNVQAEVLEFYEKDFETTMMKQFQQKLWKSQNKTTEAVVLPEPEEKEAEPCSCQKETEPNLVKFTELEEAISKASELFEKAGSRISQSTRAELQEVAMDLEAIRNMEDMPRSVTALVGNALSCISGLMGSDEEKTFDDIEKKYFAALAEFGTDALRRQFHSVKLVLSASEEQEEARELDEILSIFD